MTGTALVALLSHWRRHPLQLATLVIGLALATALWSGVQAINGEARASYTDAANTLQSIASASLRSADGGTIALADFTTLRRAGWTVSPVIEGELSIGGETYALQGIDLLSVPPAAQADRFGVRRDGGLDPVAFLVPPGQVLAAPETAELIAQDGRLPEVLVAERLASNQLVTDVGVAARLLGMPDRLSRILVLERQRSGLAPLSDLVPALRLETQGQSTDIARLTDSFHLNLTAFGFLSFAVGLFVVHAAIGLAFEQRRAMFRTLRALGLPLGRLVLLVAMELLLVALVSASFGLVLGYIVAAALLPDVAATLRGLYGASVDGVLEFRAQWALGGLSMALLGVFAAGSRSVIRVALMPILSVAQQRAWARASDRSIAVQSVGAVAILALGGAVYLGSSGLVAGFAILGAVLLSAALLLPALLALCLNLASTRAQHPLAQWFWADSRQQLPGLSLALMALLLALAANVGVGTMVASFRQTFTGWLDQRLASEIYVTAGSESEAQRLTNWLEPRVDAILPIWFVAGRIADRPAEIYGVADHATYRENWPLLVKTDGAWDQVLAGRAVFINEQLFRRTGLGLADTVTLEPGWQLPVAGVYSDYGNPNGQAIVSIPALKARHPHLPRTRFGLRVDPDDAEALRTALTREFGLSSDRVIDQATIKAFSMGVFERTFTVTGALNVLTLTVAGFAMLTSLLTLASLRLPQLAPVWAIGSTRWRLGTLELVRAMVLAALTVILALPVGLALAWLLLTVVNVEAFGWRLPMAYFPADWMRLLALALVAAAIAAMWPAIRLARTPPLRLLQVFSNER
ncbi:MAG: FtsX-like permease family protein [Pseudomonadota bacterium]